VKAANQIIPMIIQTEAIIRIYNKWF